MVQSVVQCGIENIYKLLVFCLSLVRIHELILNLPIKAFSIHLDPPNPIQGVLF